MLAEELTSLRAVLQEERRNGRARAEEMRERMRLLNEEFAAPVLGEASLAARSDVAYNPPLCTVAAVLIQSEVDKRPQSPCESSGAAGTAASVARELRESVRGLMAQGVEFRALAVRRETELRAALEASEAALRRAEARQCTCDSPAIAASQPGAVVSGTEGVNLDTAEREVLEALVRRLEAQVRALEAQVDCMSCELQSAAKRSSSTERQQSPSGAVLPEPPSPSPGGQCPSQPNSADFCHAQWAPRASSVQAPQAPTAEPMPPPELERPRAGTADRLAFAVASTEWFMMTPTATEAEARKLARHHPSERWHVSDDSMPCRTPTLDTPQRGGESTGIGVVASLRADEEEQPPEVAGCGAAFRESLAEGLMQAKGPSLSSLGGS